MTPEKPPSKEDALREYMVQFMSQVRFGKQDSKADEESWVRVIDAVNDLAAELASNELHRVRSALIGWSVAYAGSSEPTTLGHVSELFRTAAEGCYPASEAAK